MATKSPSNFSTLSQTQPGALTEFVRHYPANGCPTAADVRMRAAHVRSFRAGAYNAQPRTPAAPAVPVLVEQLPSASPTPPAAPALVLVEQVPAVPGRISIRRVLGATAKHFRTTPDDLVSHSRKQPLTRHRQIAMYVARKVAGRGLPFIAHHFGDRDHTTILHGVRAVQALIDAGDAETVAAVDQIVERLQVAVQSRLDAGVAETIAPVDQSVEQLQVTGGAHA